MFKKRKKGPFGPFFCTRGGTRTLTGLLPADFKSALATITTPELVFGSTNIGNLFCKVYEIEKNLKNKFTDPKLKEFFLIYNKDK